MALTARPEVRAARGQLRAALGPKGSDRLALIYDRGIGTIQSTLGSYRAEALRLSRLRDAYAGQRCFIIGNGPSLNSMDLEPLSTEQTFGANRIYLMFERLGFATSFLTCTNHLVWEQFGPEMLAQSSVTFVPWHERDIVPSGKDRYFIRLVPRLAFRSDLPHTGLASGATVTFASLQLAYFLGFRTAVLIGVDHFFQTTGEAHATVTGGESDPNHFDPNYFSSGVRWQLPDLDASEQVYRAAKIAWEDDGRRILDATVDGKLEIFSKVSYEQVINSHS